MAGPTYGKTAPADRLEFGIVTEQEWRSWDEMLEQWTWAEEAGFDSAWAYDHFLSLSDGELGPSLEGWTLLAGLMARTSKIQGGLLVTGITHRNPAVLFKEAVTVDIISGGRLILGVGAAWNEREHQAYGIPFPPPAERVARFGEAMEMLHLLETQERTTFHGRYYTLEAAPFEPRPVFGHIPLLIGSSGRRMMRFVARYADLWDGAGTPEETIERGRYLAALCREIGRDPAEIRWVMSMPSALTTSEDAFRDHVTRYAAVGIRSFYVHIPRGTPGKTLRAIAERVIPELRVSAVRDA